MLNPAVDTSTTVDTANKSRKRKRPEEDPEKEDPAEDRKRIFGDDQESDKSDRDEEEDEFMMVLRAVRDRSKFETHNRPLLKDKLSQTGWKLRENF